MFEVERRRSLRRSGHPPRVREELPARPRPRRRPRVARRSLVRAFAGAALMAAVAVVVVTVVGGSSSARDV